MYVIMVDMCVIYQQLLEIFFFVGILPCYLFCVYLQSSSYIYLKFCINDYIENIISRILYKRTCLTAFLAARETNNKYIIYTT